MTKKNRFDMGDTNLDKIFKGVPKDLEFIQNHVNDLGLKMFKVKTNSIVPNPYQPRKTFDDDDLQSLAESLERHGLIQPIVVSETYQNQYILVTGERRLRAAKLLDWSKISAIIVEISNDQLQILALVENIQRSNLNIIEEGQAFLNIKQKLKISDEKLGEKIGKKRTYINNAIRFLKFPDYIKEEIWNNKITPGQLRPLIAITDNKPLLQKVFTVTKAQKLNAHQVEKFVQKLKKNEELVNDFTRDRKNNIYQHKSFVNVRLCQELTNFLNAKVAISDKKIIISTRKKDQIMRVIQLILHNTQKNKNRK